MIRKISKLITSLIFVSILLIPFSGISAQSEEDVFHFKAKVLEVLEQVEKEREDGNFYIQQNLKLEALQGEREGETFIYYGVSEIEVATAHTYKEGDVVFVDVFVLASGEEIVYVTDFDRSRVIYVLMAIFILFVIFIGGRKGFRALISLFLSFFAIIGFILPQILKGRDPFLISLLGGLFIMAVIIYLTEGWKKKSHLAIISVLISLCLTLALSVIFTNLSRLTGFSSEEAVFLIGLTDVTINFKGLLLAGMLIGSIGVLDDIIIGQIEAVEQIREANPSLPPAKVFSLAYKIGNTHLGAIINTLFLTYAGAALPLLLVFSLGQETGLSLSRALNSEVITTEVVRTFVGSIGVMSSLPVATFLGAYGLKRWTKKSK